MATKSLNECINEVMNNEISQMVKRNELIKLGLCEHEVRMLLASIAPVRTRKGEFDFSKITFGVEIGLTTSFVFSPDSELSDTIL